MREDGLRRLRLVVGLLAALGTAAAVAAALAGQGAVLRIVTVLPLWAVAGFADWRLSGRWRGLYAPVFGDR
ncbi:hypothetical protein LVO79_14455 [Roseivivax marinus]|uniref:hypothetical protein n=1 Tax=Roseivivax marinus TaxID=1379903 RepID=UPI001F0383B5|nr:hypothetical protein [Roseivivax marinus]UMA64206.1 hypothetical protein LVO79_14455 [Roseivivax marinus]